MRPAGIHYHYYEILQRFQHFGVKVRKTDFVVITIHDVLFQLQLSLLNKLNDRDERHWVIRSRFNLRKAETLFKRDVYMKSVYADHKGQKVHIGWTCSKKKAKKWFKQNLNKMLGD